MWSQILAGDADATRLYDSAELLAHNLLMAMREQRFALETDQQSHSADDPLELTMAVGVPDPDHNPDARAGILTLDLTGRMNSSHS